jgi:hypothetical protein
MPGLQARFLAMLQEPEDHRDATKKRKRNENDNGEDENSSDDGNTRGGDDDDEEEENQRYAWIGVEVPKPKGERSRNGTTDRGFNKKNACAVMGIDEEKFHFIQVNNLSRDDCIL